MQFLPHVTRLEFAVAIFWYGEKRDESLKWQQSGDRNLVQWNKRFEIVDMASQSQIVRMKKYPTR
jgi:hypothetical protein